MEEDHRIVEIPGKHGRIKLVVPNREPTAEELSELHRVVAETIVNTERIKVKKEETATH